MTRKGISSFFFAGFAVLCAAACASSKTSQVGTGEGGTSGSQQGGCTITVTTQTLSTVIPTVGIVEWSTDLSGLTSANIEFGLDTAYGLTAPVDLTAANYRTLLLGMKAGGKIYHFRIVAKAGDDECTSQDYTLPATGIVPNVLPQFTVTTNAPQALSGGYLVQEKAVVGDADGPAFILDQDNEFVWWYSISASDPSRARQSYDGKYMWIMRANVDRLPGSSKVVRVSMDGLSEEDFSSDFANATHDLAVLPDETVAFLAFSDDPNGCDDVKERAPDGTVRTVMNARAALGSGECHANAIHYSREDDSLVFSDLRHSAYVKVTRQGQITWVLGDGTLNNFTGDGATWSHQHGFHLLAPDRLLFFNNGDTGAKALAIELKLDLTAMTASKVWQYAGNITTNILGDVQRLDNGNTLVTYSTAGAIHEVDATGAVLQTIYGASGSAFGYSEKRKSLYGPPPR